jgi:hypothetical protein
VLLIIVGVFFGFCGFKLECFQNEKPNNNKINFVELENNLKNNYQ